MKVLFSSDTQTTQKVKESSSSRLLIHSRDISKWGEDHEVEDFTRWLSILDYFYKIFIAGNHDFYFEDETVNRIQKMLLEDMHYLHNSGITIGGVNSWKSLVTPTFFNWAFNRNRGKDIAKHWTETPQSIDILITHGPPCGILD